MSATETNVAARRPGVVKKLFFMLLPAAVIFLLAGAVAEAYLRVFNPQLTGPMQGRFDRDLGILPIPNNVTWRRTPYYLYAAKHDAAGRRVVVNAPASARETALFLGDSFTYGSGVGDAETFSSQVQGVFNARGRVVRVVNAGNSGIGTDFSLRYYQLRGAQEKPAAVALFFFENDFRDNAVGRFFDVAADGTLRPKVLREGLVRRVVLATPGHDFLMSHLHVVAFFRGLPVMLLSRQVPVKYDPAYEGLAETYLGALAAEVERSGSSFRVFYIPSMEDVAAYRGGQKESAEEKALRAICAKRSLPLTSLTELVSTQPKRVDELYFGEGHWRPEVHALAAPVIAAAVEGDLEQRTRAAAGPR
ncbi:MAG: hypothetical protein SFV54_04195 [Bryobacteraceae bacterium]|nr:hypothetical protein [Bryobacteraceae bacterium]